MTFELAAVLVVSVVAVGLGLVCYHLLGRVEMLERSVQGGLEPPSTRLSREQFERRFRTAHARSSLGTEVDTGIVIVVGPEHTADSDLARTLEQMPRLDLIDVRAVADIDADTLGVTTTPFLFIVDQGRIRVAQPVASGFDVLAALKDLV